jgi:hypothetical protein
LDQVREASDEHQGREGRLAYELCNLCTVVVLISAVSKRSSGRVPLQIDHRTNLKILVSPKGDLRASQIFEAQLCCVQLITAPT